MENKESAVEIKIDEKFLKFVANKTKEWIELVQEDIDTMLNENEDIFFDGDFDSLSDIFFENDNQESQMSEIAEEFNQNHTFRPVTNNPVQPDKQRNLEEFLSFQNNHLKKVGELVKGMKEERESKNLELITNPMIDKVFI
jgi:hypothetical protein